MQNTNGKLPTTFNLLPLACSTMTFKTALNFQSQAYGRISLFVFVTLVVSVFGLVRPVETLAKEKPKPNVLFIAIDDLKPTLRCYGDETAITPNMDAIASRGTVFRNAHCQWPVCGPSRASLMTSLRPEAVGVMDLSTSMRAKNPNVMTLPQHFRGAGYVTAGCGKIYDPRCVDDKRELDPLSWSVPFAKISYKTIKFNSEKRFARDPVVNDKELADGAIAQNALKLMYQLSESDKPFFLAVGFKKPHLPFVAPKKYWELYQRERLSLAKHRAGIEDASGYSIHTSNEFRKYEGIPKQGEISDQLQREAIHGYYACASFIDRQIGLLTSELDKLGLADNTIIVLWGDHGFHLGDHSMWGKHSTLEQATRVPLIVCPPASKPTVGQSSSPVELTDVFPTICELAGLDMPSGISGRSLCPIIDGSRPTIRQGALTVFKSKGSLGYSFRTNRYRYTEWISKRKSEIVARELYDYQSDPLEQSNLADGSRYSKLMSQLAGKLRQEGDGCELLQSVPAKNDE